MAILTLMLGSGCTRGPEPIEFRFAPPEGVTWASSEDHSERVDVPGFGSRSIHFFVAASTSVTRASSWTYAWTERLERLEVSEDGRQLLAGLSQQVAGLELVTEVMEDGDVTAVRGQERLEAVVAQAARADDPGAAGGDLWSRRENARAAWRERVQALAGKSLKLGETVEASTLQSFGRGHDFAHRVRLTPRERKACGQAECVAVAVEYVNDPDEVARYSGRSVEVLLPDTSMLSGLVTIAGIEVSGEGERLIEPATLIVREEHTEKRIRLTLRGPERDLAIQVTVNEKGSLTPKT